MKQEHENLGSRVAKLVKEFPDANAILVMNQATALQEQYREKFGTYKTLEGLQRQENFAYDILRDNLAKGLYVGKPYKPK
jgi:hypothetical protein